MGVGRTPAHPATHPRNTHDMTKEQPDTPVMETTIEGAQKRIAKAIEDYADRCKFIGDPCETNPDLEYIAVFLDNLGDEMAAMSTATHPRNTHDMNEQPLHNEYKELIPDCLKQFKSLGVDAYHQDYSSVYVKINEDIHVEITNAEICWRADEWKDQQA